MSNRNVYGYTLRDDHGKIVYIGITDNRDEREDGHRREGKQFKDLKVETKPMTRPEARDWESGRLETYRDLMGRNPKYNKTDDGGFPFSKSRPITQRDLGGRRPISQRDLMGPRRRGRW